MAPKPSNPKSFANKAFGINVKDTLGFASVVPKREHILSPARLRQLISANATMQRRSVLPDLGKAEAEAVAWLTSYYGSDIWGTRWGPFGGPERVGARIAEYVAAGAGTVIVRFASFEPEKQLDMFLDKVAPAYA